MRSRPAGAGTPDGTGLALKDLILIALKDGAAHPRIAVRAACLEGPDGPGRTPEARAERQAQFARAVGELQAEGRITVTGSRPDATGLDAVLCLVPPAPDDRFAIDPVFRDLLPPASAGEIALLERQILSEGCRDALVTWTQAGRTFLVDGHTRLTICRRHRVDYQLTSLDKPHREAVHDWVWEHHFGRRNFTPEAESYARGRLFHAQKMSHGGDRRRSEAKAQSVILKRSAEAIAAQFKVNRQTIFRDAAFAGALDRIVAVCGPEIRTKVLCRMVPLRRGGAVLLARKDETEMKRLVADLLAGKKVILAPTAPTTVRLALPRGKPAEQAELLLEQLGPRAAGRLRDALTDRLRRGSRSEDD